MKVGNYVAMFVLLLAAVLLIYCAVNPVTGEREFMLLTGEDEIALGKQTDQQVIQQYGIYNHPGLSEYVTNIGEKLARHSHRPELHYTFRVVDSPVINAFAVPGGFLYFTRGILGYFNNEAELAGVMGHELGHVAARHSAQQYSRAQVAQLGLGLGMVFSETLREYAGLAQFGVGMLFLKFGRDAERQSDDLGVEYAMKAEYDATPMAHFFETLERLNPESAQSGLPSWFSTHPNPQDRTKAVLAQEKKWEAELKKGDYVVLREEYLRKIDGIVFGENPRHGYVEGNIFYHPELKFKFSFPSQWNLLNTATQVQIVPQQQNAAIVFSLEQASSPDEAAQKFTSQSKATVESANSLSIHGFPARRVVSQIQSQNEVIRLMSFFIQKGSNVYVFHGISSPDQFLQYSNEFSSTAGAFDDLKDQAKINVSPEKVQLKKSPVSGSLQTALQNLGAKGDDLEKFAILNGMQLSENVEKGMLIKVVSR